MQRPLLCMHHTAWQTNGITNVLTIAFMHACVRYSETTSTAINATTPKHNVFGALDVERALSVHRPKML